MAGASGHCVDKSYQGATILTHPGVGQEPSYLPTLRRPRPLSVIFIYGTNIIKNAVLYCLDDAPPFYKEGVSCVCELSRPYFV